MRREKGATCNGRASSHLVSRGLGSADAHVAVLAFQEVVHAPLGLLAAVTVALLDLANQLLVIALRRLDVVLGELAPLLLDAALELLPLTSQDVSVHRRSPSLAMPRMPTRRASRARLAPPGPAPGRTALHPTGWDEDNIGAEREAEVEGKCDDRGR